MSIGAGLIGARDLTWETGGRRILHAVSLELREGEILGLIGPNGAGKSSLLRLLAGVTPPGAGVLEWRGQPYRKLAPRLFARRVGYLEQHAPVHWPLSVRQVVEMGRLPHRAPFRPLSAEDRAAVAEAAAFCGLTGLMEHSVLALSAGQRTLVGLARLLAGRPEAALADEPVAALDPHHQLLVMETFSALVARGGFSALVVLHDLGLAARFCDRLVLLHEGRVAACGSPAEVLSPANLADCYHVRAAIRLNESPPAVVPMARVNKPNSE